MTDKINTSKPIEGENSFKTATMNAIVKLDSYKEARDELTTIRDTLCEAVEKDRMGTDPDFAKFVCDVCAPGLTKRLAKKIYTNKTVRFQSHLFEITFFLVHRCSR